MHFKFNFLNIILRSKYTLQRDPFISESLWFKMKDRVPLKKSINKSKIVMQPVISSCSDYKKYTRFSEIEDIDEKLLKPLNEMGFDEMTAIQSNTFDIIAKHSSNLLGSAETGSGKSLAFLLPILNLMLKRYPFEAIDAFKNSNYNIIYPQTVVVAPTRELVNQLTSEANKLLYYSHLRFADVIGGIPRIKQIQMLRNGPQGIIATPGRLIDLLQDNVISLKYGTNIVFDEADRLLDMGFSKDIRKILDYASIDEELAKSQSQQISMFSATFSDEVMQLVDNYMGRDYTRVVVGDDVGHDTPRIPSCIKQEFVFSDDFPLKSFDYIMNIHEEIGKTIIFCNTRMVTDKIHYLLKRKGLRVTKLSGDSSQDMRQMSIKSFKDGRNDILVATNVAARGLDVSDVQTIINNEMPVDLDSYIHRAGRCGRMGKEGKVITLLSTKENIAINRKLLKSLIEYMKQCKIEVPSELEAMIRSSMPEYILRDRVSGGPRRPYQQRSRDYNTHDNSDGRYQMRFHQKYA